MDFPAELLPGVFTDLASVWHTADMFVLDFLTITQPIQEDASDPEHPVNVITARAVVRVRFPPSQVFEIAKALTQQLEQWELGA